MRLPVLSLALLAATSLQAQGFEGSVTYALKSERGSGEMTVSTKGGKLRMDMAAGGRSMYVLVGADAPVVTMVMPEQKMFMAMDPKAMGSMAGSEHAHGPGKITATGKTETIAGRSCSGYLVGEKQDLEICAAKGMGIWRTPQGPMSGRGPLSALGALGDPENPEFAKLAAEGFWPLKVTSLEGGKSNVLMEATKVEAKPLDGSIFEVPAGYTAMPMMGAPRQ